jgi:hypothetical protein
MQPVSKVGLQVTGWTILDGVDGRHRRMRYARIQDEFTNLPVSKARKCQLRHHRDGLCIYCSDPQVRNRRCEKHAKIADRKAAVHKQGNKLKNDARTAVTRALVNGTMVRQKCKICDEPGQVHHEDYSKPLEVIWLCRKHHALYEGRTYAEGGV